MKLSDGSDYYRIPEFSEKSGLDGEISNELELRAAS
jgi:hypothetical protein